MRAKTPLGRVADVLSSLKLTLVCLGLLMILVVACTLLQVPLGTHLAVERTIRSWPGGLIGGALLLNLLFAQFLRLELSPRKAGLWLTHLGLALLFVGEFSTALFQVESQMPIEVGQTRGYCEDSRQMELAVVDATDPSADIVTSIPESILKNNGEISHPSLPFTIKVRRWYDNASLGMRKPEDPPSEATGGVGAGLRVRPEPVVTADDAQNSAASLIEASSRGQSLGSFWVSPALGAPQGFTREDKDWRLVLRPRRYSLPFTLTLKEFKHDIYPGTDIPKNFSSLVRLVDPAAGEDRDALIYMNSPLRYGGKTFYQASFGKDDRLSILQVVRNPGWLIPYLSCALVALGLLLHFGVKLSSSLRQAR